MTDSNTLQTSETLANLWTNTSTNMDTRTDFRLADTSYVTTNVEGQGDSTDEEYSIYGADLKLRSVPGDLGAFEIDDATPAAAGTKLALFLT